VARFIDSRFFACGGLDGTVFLNEPYVLAQNGTGKIQALFGEVLHQGEKGAVL
jgi:hypothetical protein